MELTQKNLVLYYRLKGITFIYSCILDFSPFQPSYSFIYKVITKQVREKFIKYWYISGLFWKFIPKKIYIFRLFMSTSEKSSRSCTSRKKSFPRMDPQQFAPLKEDEVHKQYQLKMST